MAKYNVHVFCDECGETHPMHIQITLADGPADKASIGDTYAGRDLPPEIVNCLGNQIVCPKTRKWFTQKNNHQIFLVPVG